MIDLNIMVVEDETLILETLISVLKREVKELRSYSNASGALKDFESFPPDLVITDIQMPEMNGLDMCKMMREINPQLPIVVMSAFSEPRYFLDAIALKIDYFLPKPISIDELLEKIKKIDIELNLRKELKLKEIALQNEKNKLKDILNNVISIVALVSLKKNILFVNHKFLQLLPFVSLEDFKSQHQCICELFLFREGYLQTIVDGLFWIEYMKKNPDKDFYACMHDRKGVERHFLVNQKLVQDNEDELFVLTFTDLTSLKKAQKEAKVASEAKIDFLRNMSHEVRTPLNGITGVLPLLEKRIEPSSKEHKYIKLIKNSANALEFMLENILSFSKINIQNLELNYKKVDLNIEMNNIHTAITQIDNNSNIKLKINPNISKCLLIDIEKLKQVLTNLLHNAVKFTHDESEILLYATIILKTDDSQQIQFGIKDNGVGIKKEHLKKIFELFTQSDSSLVRAHDGTGLGLTLSKKFIESMESKLHVNSEEGKGSEFYFTLTLQVCEN